MIKYSLKNCHDCCVEPGEPHNENCDVERCSVCGSQRLICNRDGHDPVFSRWTGIWPGLAESEYIGVDLNQFYINGYYTKFFVKPRSI